MDTKQINTKDMLEGYESLLIGDLMLMPKTKKEALLLDESYYFNGVCEQGHLAIRDASTGRCLKCLVKIRKRDYENNRETRIQKAVEYNRVKYKTDPRFKAGKIARSQLQRILKATKLEKNSTSFELLGYSVEDFKENIESKFQNGMSWGNYGEVWQLDHTKAIALFDISLVEDIALVNSLSNLQPMFIEHHKLKTIKDLVLIRDKNNSIK